MNGMCYSWVEAKLCRWLAAKKHDVCTTQPGGYNARQEGRPGATAPLLNLPLDDTWHTRRSSLGLACYLHNSSRSRATLLWSCPPTTGSQGNAP